MKKIMFGLISTVLGILISMSIREKAEIMSPMSIEKIENYNRELNVVENQINVDKEIISHIKSSIEEKSSPAYQNELKRSLQNELKELKILSGEYDIKGEGIVIMIDDSKNEDYKNTNLGIIHDIDIMIILNELKAAGVDAISINDVRVMGDSEIKCMGPTVKVDGHSKATPFIIKAVGDMEMIYNIMSDKNSYINLLETTYYMDVKVEKNKNIIIPKRDGRM
ncbi:DUF881 domain-containing protein [Ezakiella coagulans]|uniref:DUF881 domain-containing protein n=1 Tax=Ezakiella coagulans TaxID=46507 RepID=UPI002014A145|nr:DUF881 domain-containing protein [Ezakiella coagulans]UQK60977.1 DUF881 domain-containing protein [Ezakiella coagulans]